MKKILTFIYGFCMALADSVPGVSGGTVAFLLGFYDNFVGSLDDLISGTKKKRISAIKYLIKLGIGWTIGFGLAVIILANVFETHIYQISSLFMGFIIFAIPIVIIEEKRLSERKNQQNIFCNDRYCTGIRHYIFQSGWRREWYEFEQPKYINICICICLRSNCNLCYDSAGNIWVNAAFDFRNLSANCHSNQGYSAFQFSRTANRDRIWIGRGYRSDINYQDHQKSS